MSQSQRVPLNLERELLALRERYAHLTPKQASRLDELRQSSDQPMAPGMPVPPPNPTEPVIAPPDFTAPKRQNRVRFRVR